MPLFYQWEFSEASLGKNSDFNSHESKSNIFFKQLIDDVSLDPNNYFDGYTIQNHNDIGYLDINSIITPDASFTLEFDVQEIGDSIDISKSINYLTYGYHIRGQLGVSLTVGRNVGSSNVTIGMITKDSVIKGLPIKDRWFTEPNKLYRYTLTYNNFATNDHKIKLFRGANLISSSSNFEIQNMSFIDRKIFIGSSAWTNEPDWNGTFDVAKNIVFKNVMKLIPNKVIDKSFIPGTPEYPLHVAYTNLSDTYRLNNQLIKSNDEVEIIFTCARDSHPSTVNVLIFGSNNTEGEYNYVDATLMSADTIPLENGSNTVKFTYKFTATEEYPIDGFLNYKLDFDGSVTPCNIDIPLNDVLYVDNTYPDMIYSFSDPSDNNIGLTLLSIQDDYLSAMNKQDFVDYSITFFATNETENKFVTIDTPTINQTYYIDNLNSETFYTIYATITDVAGNTNQSVLPNNPSSLIETVDITYPIVNFVSSESIENDIHKAGIKITLNTYDTACKNGNTYKYYMTVTNQQLSSDNNLIFDFIKNNYLFSETKYNFVQETNMIHEIYEYFVNNVKYEIQPEILYHTYMLAIDDASNISVQHKTHVIDNTISFVDAFTDYTDNIIGQQNNIITLNFTSKYFITADQLNTTLVFATTPLSDDGITWQAHRTIQSSDPDGQINLKVLQNPDIGGSTSGFNNPKVLYIQNSPPSFKPNISLTSDVTTITVNNISNYINDFTINNNNDLVKLTLKIGSQIQTNEYANKSAIPSTFVFDNLLENKQYGVYGSLSNIFKESAELFIGNITTKTDIPTIVINASTSNQDGNPVINLLDTSTLFEKTTPFDVYVAATDFIMTNDNASNLFFNNISTTQIGSNISPLNVNQVINDICTKNKFVTYWDSSFNSNDLIVQYKSNYYLYGMVFDQHNYTIAHSPITFDFSISTPVVSNLSFSYFVRHNDNIEMSWSSAYKTEATDYNVNMFNSFVVPTSSDNMNWLASINTPEYGDFIDTFQVVFLNELKDVDTSGIHLDYSAPTFTLTSTRVGASSLDFSLTNVQDQFYSGETLSYSGPNTFDIVLSASNENVYQEYTYNDLLFDDLSTLTFIADNLEQNNIYTVFCKIVDQASNTRLVPYNNDGLIYTTDSVIPVVTNTSANIFHTENTSNVTVSNVLAYDKHSSFDIYIALFNSNTYNISSNIFLDNSNSSAVLFKKHNTKRDIYASFNGVLDSFLDFNGNVWNTYPLEYNTTNYIYTLCIDSFSNVNVNYTSVFATVPISSQPIDTSEIVIDETETQDNGVTEQSASDVTFTETTTTTDSSTTDDTVAFTETYEEIELETTDIVQFEADIIEQTAVDANVSNDQVVVDSIESGSVVVNVTIRFRPTETSKIDAMKTRLESTYKNPVLTQKYKSSVRKNIVQGKKDFTDQITTTGYIGYDTSGNNNHLFITTLNDNTINPLNDNTETDVQGTINLGKVANIRFASSLRFNSTFTFSVEFKNNNASFVEFVLLQNDNSDLIKVSNTGITFISGVTSFFPIELQVRKFYTLTLISENGTVFVYINGEKVSISTSNGAFQDPNGILSIPQQENILLRSIKVYASPLSVENIVKLYTPADKVIQLGFDSEGYIFEYNVTFSNNDFYFNNVKSPELELHKNGIYSFYQSPNNNVPLFFSSSNNDIDSSIIENFNIQYFSDDTQLVNNIKYATNFQSSIMNRIVIKADLDSLPNNFYYTSIDNHSLSTRISISSNEPLVFNIADTSANAQPTYNIQPQYTSNTPVGEFAMIFDADKENSLEINNIFIDPNTLTLSTWINFNNLKYDSNPIISQQNVFEYGITKNGLTYFKML